jgi:hypothetical protein
MKIIVGASLLAKALCQAISMLLIHSFREQASSHRGFAAMPLVAFRPLYFRFGLCPGGLLQHLHCIINHCLAHGRQIMRGPDVSVGITVKGSISGQFLGKEQKNQTPWLTHHRGERLE